MSCEVAGSGVSASVCRGVHLAILTGAMRGRVQVGMVADITIFDPENVTDNATYKVGENGLPTTGIPCVIINGWIVVKDSKALKVWAAHPLSCRGRRSVCSGC